MTALRRTPPTWSADRIGLRNRDHLRAVLDGMAGRGTLWVVADVHSRDYRTTDTLSAGRRFVEDFWAAHPGVTVRSADPLLDSLRVVKSPAEIALLHRAIAITDEAQLAAMRAVRPAPTRGRFTPSWTTPSAVQGASGPSFRAIIGSGPNSTSYHYRANDRVMQRARWW